jgi:Pvc16 N-terminal domain
VATFQAVEHVSQTLVSLLTTGLSGLGTQVQVNDLQTTPANSNLLTLFLFRITEDSHSRNRPPEVRVSGTPASAGLRKPPLALCVHYMLTPWGQHFPENHRILGEAMRTLHDNAIVTGASLSGSLAPDEDLHFTMVPVSLEDQLRVWYAINKPYRLSLYYEVRVVRIESTVTVQRAVVRERGITPAEAGA